MDQYPLNHRPAKEDRRRGPRWRDKRLLLLSDGDGECPGMTYDISLRGLRLALPRCPSDNDRELAVRVAFAQEVIEIRGRLAYTLSRPWGVLAGLQFAPGQEELLRFLARRYPALASPSRPPSPGPDIRLAPTNGEGQLSFPQPRGRTLWWSATRNRSAR
jgi:hypothetical protein